MERKIWILIDYNVEFVVPMYHDAPTRNLKLKVSI